MQSARVQQSRARQMNLRANGPNASSQKSSNHTHPLTLALLWQGCSRTMTTSAPVPSNNLVEYNQRRRCGSSHICSASVRRPLRAKKEPRALFKNDSENGSQFLLQTCRDTPSYVPYSSGQTKCPNNIIVQVSKSPSRAQRTITKLAGQNRFRREFEKRRRQGEANWPRLLRWIDSHTPFQPPRADSLTVRGSADTLTQLYYEILNTTTYNVIPEPPVLIWSEGQMKVDGTHTAICAFRTRFINATESRDMLMQGLRICDGTRHSSPLEETRISTHMYVSKRVRYAETTTLASEICTPTSWTFRSLLEYISALTRSRKKPSMSLMNKNKDDAAFLLEKALFHNPETREALSYVAIHRAIAYLIEQRKTPKAVEFLALMQDAGFSPNAQTYNLHLFGCAVEQNLLAFERFTRLMAQRQVQPNEQTWLAFLLAAPTTYAKQVVARRMYQKGISVSSLTSYEDVPSFVPFSFGPFLDSGSSSKQYIDSIDNLFGTNWLNEQVAISLVAILIQRNALAEAVDVLNICVARRGELVTNHAFHKLLAYAAGQRNADFAVWLTVYAKATWCAHTPDHITLELLFRVAIRSRMYNLARVVWKYAAARGELTHRMRVKVFFSLRESTQPATKIVGRRWHASFGPVICGRQPTSSSESSARVVLDWERNNLMNFRFRASFTSVIVAALAMDKEWTMTGAKNSTSTEWKIANAVKVPLEQKK